MAHVKERLISNHTSGRSDLPIRQTAYPGELEEISPVSPSQPQLQKRQFIQPVSQPLQLTHQTQQMR
jgi:hypothetical protein